VYGSLGRPFLLMKLISSTQCLTSVYTALSSFGDQTISFPFDTLQITTRNVVFGNCGMLLLAILLTHSPKSVAGHLLPRLSFFLAFLISLAHFFQTISTHSRRIHSALSKLSKRNQVSNFFKESATALSLCRGPFLSYFNWFCPQIMDRCLFSRNPATHPVFHLLNAL
jgi:hypothetical protein